MTNTDYNFRVIQNIYYRRNQWIHEVAITYQFSVDKIDNNNFKLVMREFTFKNKDNKVVYGIAAAIIQEYTKVIFPLSFEAKGNELILCNYQEIAQRLRLKKEELKQNPKYFTAENIESNVDQFHIINEIGEYFISLMVEDGHVVAPSYLDLDMIKFILFSMIKPDSNEVHNLSLKLNPLGFYTNWAISQILTPNLYAIKYNGEITNRAALFENLRETSEAEEYRINTIEGEKLIDSDFTHEVQFASDKYDFEFSETKIKVNHDYYSYEETLYLSIINNKKPT